ncbi:ABATE domain-containing protein [Streptacidiphilus sp. P02-A3a]|uniref:CGNR zinc finger domain-containing protein n=1 Tax=Streptacidiphilus sp. P02-A3a TaxID=2704468 RepID=UPI0015F9485B|nr:CGNR zinc finger domain-containing protein [Streptacidiphilus sp. P02-A3a]QMU73088.1 CGNR zinc finger domain-containing protein [Streptacidiphilus sp. P02-A3a]
MSTTDRRPSSQPLPTAPPPAPGADRHVALDFANTTLTMPGGVRLDLLGSPAQATGWLVDHRLAPPDAELMELCAGRLRTLRDHVRELLAARIDDGAPPAPALAALNEALTLAPAVDLLAWDEAAGPRRVRPHPADRIAEHAMARIAADAVDLLTAADADRLAGCGAGDCSRYLLRTHAARHWCSVRCGDRIRAARSYARRTQGEQRG